MNNPTHEFKPLKLQDYLEDAVEQLGPTFEAELVNEYNKSEDV